MLLTVTKSKSSFVSVFTKVDQTSPISRDRTPKVRTALVRAIKLLMRAEEEATQSWRSLKTFLFHYMAYVVKFTM